MYACTLTQPLTQAGPMTLLVAWLFSGFDVSRALQLPDLPVLYGDVLLISLLTNGAYHFVFQGRDQPQSLANPDPEITYEDAISHADSPNDLRLMIKLAAETTGSSSIQSGFSLEVTEDDKKGVES